MTHQDTALERLQVRMRADGAMLKHLGMQVDAQSLTAGDPDRTRLSLHVSGVLVNALGFCHGGVLYSLADTACAYALGAAGLTPATIDASVTYIRAAREGETVHTECEVLNAGKRHGTCEVRLRNENEDLILGVPRHLR